MAGRIKKSPAVFIDRDGTIIRERNYLSKVEDVVLIKGAAEAIRLFNKRGFKVVIVTNQSGVGRGFYTEEKVVQVHKFLKSLLAGKGALIDAIYYCPHHPEFKCKCRKPATGMVKKAQKDLSIDLKKSYTIGDHKCDFLLGQNMGGKGVFILTGHGKHEIKKIKAEPLKFIPDKITKNILSAARWVLRDCEK